MQERSAGRYRGRTLGGSLTPRSESGAPRSPRLLPAALCALWMKLFCGSPLVFPSSLARSGERDQGSLCGTSQAACVLASHLRGPLDYREEAPTASAAPAWSPHHCGSTEQLRQEMEAHVLLRKTGPCTWASSSDPMALNNS
jgi:hypothetical protein